MRHSPNQKPRQETTKHPLTAPTTENQHGHRQAVDGGRRISLLCDLPPESRTHITAYLDPPSLDALGQTCKLLRAHVADESTWYHAFLCQFLGVGPEASLSDETALLLRRQQKSWRLEFAYRHKMRGRWQRSRNTTVVHSPVHSYVNAIHPLANGGLLTCSLRYGIVARSHPLTGKVVKGFLSASGGGAGLGIGNPNLEFAPDATACALTSEGATARVAWGYRNGQLAIVIAKKAMEGKVAADFSLCRVDDFHEGAVVDVVWEQDMVVSAAADGRLKIWQKRHMIQCLWTSPKDERAVVPVKCAKVVSALARGFIACVMENGDILLWRGFVLGDAQDAGTPRVDAENVSVVRVPCPLPKPSSENLVDALPEVLAFHADKTAPKPTVLVAYLQQAFFYRIAVAGPADIRISTYGDPAFRLTSVASFFTSEPTEHSFVLAGDHLGTIAIYDWAGKQVVTSTTDNSSPSLTSPLRKIDAHDAAVTALASNGVVIATGSARGAIHAYDALTLERVRTFDALETRSATKDKEKKRDKETREMLLATVGDEVLAWQLGKVPKTQRHVMVGAKGKGRAWRERKIEIREGMASAKDADRNFPGRHLSNSNFSQGNVNKQARVQQAKMDALGLDEAEALEYVMMLSREEALFGDARAVDDGPQATVDEGVFEGDFDSASLAGADIASLAGVDDASLAGVDDSPGSSGISSLSPPSGRPIPPSTSSRRTSPPATSAWAFLPSPSLAPASLDDEVAFPSVSPHTPSSSVRASPPTTTQSAWSTPLRASPPSSSVRASPPSSSVQSAWGTPLRMTPGSGRIRVSGSGPDVSAAITSAAGAWSSVSAASLRSPETRTSPRSSTVNDVQPEPSAPRSPTTEDNEVMGDTENMDDMDDDLRYAIELSLAEARSRGEAV
ncbi:hypothetical protein GGG16DRAFT_51390 [Schizophyllum commune]